MDTNVQNENMIRKKLILNDKSCQSPRNDSQNGIIDYSPTIFLRCHSKNNDAADKRTGVWQCAFEPTRRGSHNEYPNTRFATCGGNSVCFVDAKTKKVKTKHYSESDDEDFTALAWTSILTVDGQMNILAVAGKKTVLHLLHPDQAVCFAEHNLLKNQGKKKTYIESMIFHPIQPSILFGVHKSTNSAEIRVWDIGTPHPPEYTSNLELIQTLPMESPGAALSFSTYCNMLLCATETGVVGWLMPATPLKKADKFKKKTFKFPSNSENVAPEDQNFVDSIEAIGDGKMVATKCALHGSIYIWNLEDTLASEARVVKPVHVLKWSSTDNYYMNLGINAGASVLACGDDKGHLWVYNLEEILGERSPEHACKNIIEWPDVDDVALAKHKMLKFNNIDIVVNKVALNYDATYMVAVTSTNTVCIWSRKD